MSKLMVVRRFVLFTFTLGTVLVGFTNCSPGFRTTASLDAPLSIGNLATAPSDVQKTGAVTTKARMGDRSYVANVLQEIYTTGTAPSDAAVKTAITNTVYADAHFFGGIAYDYDPPEMHTLTNIDYAGTTTYANLGAPVAAVMIGVCTTLNETSGVVSVVETKSGLVGNNSPTASDFAGLYKLFYPMNKDNTTALTALQTLFNQVKTASNRTDALKTVIYTLCTSPDWMVL